jgi:hypothetical protein
VYVPVHFLIWYVKIATNYMKARVCIINLPEKVMRKLVRSDVAVERGDHNPAEALQRETPRRCSMTPGALLWPPGLQMPPPSNESAPSEAPFGGGGGRCAMYVKP